jgi:hypothetical protein
VTRRIWLIAAMALLAACGGDDDGASTTASTSSPDQTTPVTSVSPTAMQSTTAVPDQTTVIATAVAATTVPTPSTEIDVSTSAATVATTVAPCSAAPTFDPDSPLRQQFLAYLVTCGFTEPEAACLFDHLDFTDPAVAGGDPDAMAPAFEECRIDGGRLAEIGRP